MSHFSLLVKMTEQMYEDIRFVAENNPTQVVDDESTRMFNALLAQIRAARPEEILLTIFSDMNPRTLKYKDAVVVTGQLRCLTRAIDTLPKSYDDLIRKSQEEILMVSDDKIPSPPRSASMQKTDDRHLIEDHQPLEEEVHVDEELYGTRNLRVNEHGIVPFNLSDS